MFGDFTDPLAGFGLLCVTSFGFATFLYLFGRRPRG